MQIGKLTFAPIMENSEIVAEPIRNMLVRNSSQAGIYIAPIDPELADTAAFCRTYDVPLGISTNCIVVEAKRGDKVWYAACLIMATDLIDVNSKVRKYLNARKISFAPMDTALRLTGMEHGGITPLGLPEDWPILADEKVLSQENVVIGGGTRGSKILVSTKVLASLPNAVTLDITK